MANLDLAGIITRTCSDLKAKFAALTHTHAAADITSGTLDAARLPVATTSAVGGVKVDGTTVTISNGVISAAGGGSVEPATTAPAMDGTAAVGTSTKYARADHVHPTDTSRAAAVHAHGNITSGGDITASAAIASGDRLVINDESASKITNSSITFGTSTTTFLANNGTWQTPAGGGGGGSTWTAVSGAEVAGESGEIGVYSDGHTVYVGGDAVVPNMDGVLVTGLPETAALVRTTLILTQGGDYLGVMDAFVEYGELFYDSNNWDPETYASSEASFALTYPIITS